MSIKRRTFVKGSFASSALIIAAGAGLLKPGEVLAAWPENAFAAKDIGEAMNILLGGNKPLEGDITIKAPEVAEHGAVVPISVSSKIEDVQSISIFVTNNPQPLACSFDLVGDVDAYVSTRIKMGETSDVIAVIRTKENLYAASKNVKVITGGCGG